MCIGRDTKIQAKGVGKLGYRLEQNSHLSLHFSSFVLLCFCYRAYDDSCYMYKLGKF